MDVHGKQVLVFGLGLLGGGVATTAWLLKEGATVRVTDMKDEVTLAPSIKKLGAHAELSFTLGKHTEEDVRWADLVVVNPGVPKENPYLALARRLKKPLWNDTALFFSHINRPVVAVTGTRGKTTVSSWIAQLLSQKGKKVLPTGNTPENPLLLEIGRKAPSGTPVVAELSSWQLELLPTASSAPRVSVITNLYPDHLNRYRDIREYADAKANIFLGQTKDDALILKKDDEWTKYFLAKNPVVRVFYSSLIPLEKGEQGIAVKEDVAYMFLGSKTTKLFSVKQFREERGEHNLSNLLQALLAVALIAPRTPLSEKRALALIAPQFRQELVLKLKNLVVVNDTTATSPDGTIAALRRFKAQGRVILITGGTDKQLDFSQLGKEIKTSLTEESIIFLEGSATTKLRHDLRGWAKQVEEKTTLKECLREAKEMIKKEKGKVILLFSPGSASFEKFKNEFDRGEQFNKLIKSL